MKGKAICPRFLTANGPVLLCFLLLVVGLGCKHKTKDGVSRLRKISAFKVDRALLPQFVRGQLSTCDEQPESEVRTYPAFKSDKPLYGAIRFGGGYDQEDSGILYHFAVDESRGTGKGYDRLYFDLDRDLDLANDEPRAPLKRPPKGATLQNSQLKQQTCFNYLPVDFEPGSAGQRPLDIMPRLMIYGSGHANLSFVATEARKGRIRISGQRYDVFLGHNYMVGGQFDRPLTPLHLIAEDASSYSPSWWGSDRLMAIHKIGQTHYRFSATPSGDKLTVRPYDGDFGIFEIGAGGRDIQKTNVRGSLSSRDAAVAVGGKLKDGWPQPVQSCLIPVGDYLPRSLEIEYGPLRISISENYHSDGKPLDMAARPRVYSINIRKNDAYILDLSNEPEVMFALPTLNHRVKLGQELTVKAVLTDPELDIMIRDLRVMIDGYDSNGRRRPYPKLQSLDPQVVITGADGEKLADGVMPFG
ncbi:MAG: hypothetical protein ISS70_03660 [Phycisphaerae bacterium]|nr:hypothetical protein [Phycisphaerae bacterium]